MEMQRLNNLLTAGAGIALTALLVFNAGLARAGMDGRQYVVFGAGSALYAFALPEPAGAH